VAGFGWRARTGVAVGAGLALLVAGALLAAYAFIGNQPPAPYVYEWPAASGAPAAGAADEAGLALAQRVPGAELKAVGLRSRATGRLLASGAVLARADAPDLIIAWQSGVGEPVLRADISAAEEQALVAALETHLPADSLVFAMPSLSYRLAAMVPARFPLAAADDSAMRRTPDPWAGASRAIAAIEKRWRPAPDRQADRLFESFLEALAADDRHGIARLQLMAETRPSYVILHLRDAFGIGLAMPGRFGVAQRDFPGSSDVHDLTRLVKTWAQDAGFPAYAVMPRDADAVRAYLLDETAGGPSLLGQLLPFSPARIGQVPAAQLVFQHGGYWVYRIAEVGKG